MRPEMASICAGRADLSVLGFPFRLACLALRNRFVMAPMTRECALDGVPTAEMAAYYARRAEGGVGLIVTEGAAPNNEGRFGRNVPRLYGADALAGWASVVRQVHAGGASIFAQIWHVGAFTPSMVGMEDSLDVERLSPSGLAASDRPFGRVMTRADIARTVRDFAEAARLAREVGFDGIEIHGAHGYLPDQFFWAETNLRDDRYGGGIAERSRFAAEIVAECKARTGPGFPVVLRLSQWKQSNYLSHVTDSPEELSAWLTPIVEAGVDGFHVSTRRFWDPAFSGNERTLAGWVRRLSRKPVIAVGSVLLNVDFKAPEGKARAALVPETLERAAEGIEQDEFDQIAIGRALLANPDLVNRVLSGDMAGLKNYDRSYLDRLI